MTANSECEPKILSDSGFVHCPQNAHCPQKCIAELTESTEIQTIPFTYWGPAPCHPDLFLIHRVKNTHWFQKMFQIKRLKHLCLDFQSTYFTHF